MDNMFKWAPIIFYIIQVLLLLGYHLDKEYPQIIAELEERRSSKGGK
jgi:Na+/melibiose symporter-like transporter